MRKAWTLIKDSVMSFIDDGALSRGAAIAYYTIFSLAPVLLIVVAIAGLVFGQEAAQGALFGQLRGLMGEQAAGVLQTMLANASNRSSGVWATIIGFGTLLITASGVFGEMQSSLNIIWKAEAPAGLSAIVRTRAASLGLVAALGFLLIVSLVVSAGLSALGNWLNSFLPGAEFLLQALNFLVSFLLLSALFAAIYKVLPDKSLAWRDVMVGAAVTSLLFTVGKTLIGLYIGSSSVASSYGAAGAFVIVLLWIYYSAQIFLLGAEFTKVYAAEHGSEEGAAAAAAALAPPGPQVVVREPAIALFDLAALGVLLALVVKRQRKPT